MSVLLKHATDEINNVLAGGTLEVKEDHALWVCIPMDFASYAVVAIGTSVKLGEEIVAIKNKIILFKFCFPIRNDIFLFLQARLK